MKRHCSLAGVLALTLLVLLSGLTSAAAQPQPAGREARSEPLVIGLGGAVTSLDPHYHNYTPNKAVWRHVLESLTEVDRALQLRPALALSWRRVDDLVWEFALRPGVRFHDGRPLGAADVVASLQRAATVGDAPLMVLRPVPHKIEVVDPLTVRITTTGPNPLLADQLSSVAIVPAAEAARSREDFDRRGGLIGTGPYRFISWQPGQQVVLEANAGYWGEPPRWSRVTLRLLPDDAARVAALITGEVQVIDRVPPNDLGRLRANAAFTVTSTATRRLIYLALDCDRDQSPFLRDAAGQLLATNPLRDPRVRRALSLAINRADLAANVLQGLAQPAGQMLPVGDAGTSPRLAPDAYDPAAARRLLAEAGYPDGFALILHGPAQRYTADVAVLSAIATMLTRAGLATEPVAVPSGEFFPRASRREFSLLLAGFASHSSEPLDMMMALVASYDPVRGLGSINRGRYHNSQLDRVLLQAQGTGDTAARRRLLEQAAELAFDDQAIVPLYHEVAAWASRDGIVYQPRADQLSLATDARRP